MAQPGSLALTGVTDSTAPLLPKLTRLEADHYVVELDVLNAAGLPFTVLVFADAVSQDTRGRVALTWRMTTGHWYDHYLDDRPDLLAALRSSLLGPDVSLLCDVTDACVTGSEPEFAVDTEGNHLPLIGPARSLAESYMRSAWEVVVGHPAAAADLRHRKAAFAVESVEFLTSAIRGRQRVSVWVHEQIAAGQESGSWAADLAQNEAVLAHLVEQLEVTLDQIT